MEIKLKTKHIIMLSKIVSKMELKIEVKGKTQAEIGADLIFSLIPNIHKAETEFYTLLADLTGFNAEKVAEMDVTELTEEIKTIFDGIKVFFK